MLTYFVPYGFGGGADYAQHQIRALAETGIKIELVAPRPVEEHCADIPLVSFTEIIDRRPKKLPKVLRAAAFLAETLKVYGTLARHIEKSPADYVLLGDFVEYFAPLWVPRFQRIKKRKQLRFGCTLHDPVRDFVRGPQWWHEASVRMAFRLLDDVFLHGTPPDYLKRDYPSLNVVEVPHGIFSAGARGVRKQEARERWQLPTEAKVLLQFGHIRDNKNIEVLIRNLRGLPDFYLIIAGEESSGGQKGGDFYRHLAAEMGVADRVCFQLGFIPRETIPDLFAAADAASLIYAPSFKSMSGVLSYAIDHEVPVIASGGDGPMKTIVQGYHLGEWLTEASEQAVCQGVRRLFDSGAAKPEWAKCREECSWARNAAIVANCIKAGNTTDS